MIQELIKITDEADKLLNALFELLEMLFNIWSKKKINKEEEKQVSNSILGQLIKTFKNEWETGVESKQNHIVGNVLKNDPKRAALFSSEILKKEEPKLTKIIEQDPDVFKDYKIRMETLKRNKEVGIDDSVENFLEKKQDVDYLKNLKELSEEEKQVEEVKSNKTKTSPPIIAQQLEKLKNSFEKLTNEKLSSEEKENHENVISKSALFSYRYAKETKQLFPKGEKAINKIEKYKLAYNALKPPLQDLQEKTKVKGRSI